MDMRTGELLDEAKANELVRKGKIDPADVRRLDEHGQPTDETFTTATAPAEKPSKRQRIFYKMHGGVIRQRHDPSYTKKKKVPRRKR